jgi:hypothetical protein
LYEIYDNTPEGDEKDKAWETYATEKKRIWNDWKDLYNKRYERLIDEDYW